MIFLEQIIFHAEQMNIPQLRFFQNPNSKDASLGASSKSQRNKDLGTRTLASKTTSLEETSEKNQDENKRLPFNAKSKQEKDVKNKLHCPYHPTKTHSSDSCKKFGVLSFEDCTKCNKHIAKECDLTPPKCHICEKKHLTVSHNPTEDKETKEETLSACTQICGKNEDNRSCARIV